MDIVARLRQIDRAYLFCQWFHPDEDKKVLPIGDYMNDAADEIERLREALDKIVNVENDSMYGYFDMTVKCIETARSALQQKDNE